MPAAIAEKGLMVIDVTAHGKSGHAARNEGENAIYKALDDIQWFRQFHFDKESPLLGPVKMSVTIIQAGTQHNVIPTNVNLPLMYVATSSIPMRKSLKSSVIIFKERLKQDLSV